MIETPRIIDTQARAAAIIRLTVARSEMMKVFGPAVGELMAALASQTFTPNSKSKASGLILRW